MASYEPLWRFEVVAGPPDPANWDVQLCLNSSCFEMSREKADELIAALAEATSTYAGNSGYVK